MLASNHDDRDTCTLLNVAETPRVLPGPSMYTRYVAPSYGTDGWNWLPVLTLRALSLATAALEQKKHVVPRRHRSRGRYLLFPHRAQTASQEQVAEIPVAAADALAAWAFCAQVNGGEHVHPAEPPWTRIEGRAYLPCVPDRSTGVAAVAPSRAGSGKGSCHHRISRRRQISPRSSHRWCRSPQVWTIDF